MDAGDVKVDDDGRSPVCDGMILAYHWQDALYTVHSSRTPVVSGMMM